MKKTKLGLIGLGERGGFWLQVLLEMEDVEITALCEQHEDRLENAAKKVEEIYKHSVFTTTDYRELNRFDHCEAVIVATNWNTHVPICIDALRQGKYVGAEVGPAQSVRQCWDLVRAQEETGIPYMMLENCCYDRKEMAVLNMIKKGLFGEIVHCEGGYEHDLRSTAGMWNSDHERCWQYFHRNGELYPTHEMGPILSYLELNRGNRILTLSSMSSKACGLTKFNKDHPDPARPELFSKPFRLGDVTTTLLRCANGETIVLTHDVCSPRPYSRAGRVQGTGGIWMEDRMAVHFEGRSPAGEWEPIEKYYEEFDHPLWKKSKAADRTQGHGGMDWLVMRAFLYSVRNRITPPIDVYDGATMMAIGILSEESVALGGMPVAFPDFTDGMWVKRVPRPKSIFSLDEVDESIFEGDLPF